MAPAAAGGWLCVLLLAVYVVLFALGAGFFVVPATLLPLASRGLALKHRRASP